VPFIVTVSFNHCTVLFYFVTEMTEKLSAWFLHHNGNWKNERSMNYIGCPESNAPYFCFLAINKAMNVIF